MCLTIFLTILRKINIDLRLDLKFVTEPYTAQGICRVLRYEGGGGGSKKPKSRYVICESSLIDLHAK
jgi:hypothetical protein